MRLAFTVLFLVLSTETLYLDQKGKAGPNYYEPQFPVFNLKAKVPDSWRTVDSKGEGFMIYPRKEVKLLGGGEAIPYIAVYRANNEVCVAQDFLSGKRTPGDDAVFYEKHICNGKVWTTVVYWDKDPEKEKTKVMLESILSSFEPLKVETKIPAKPKG